MASSPRTDVSADADLAAGRDASIRGLRRWMRIVGGCYVLLALFNTPPVITARFEAQYPDLEVAVDSPAAGALVDVWFMFGLEVVVIGAALLFLARDPLRGLPLVWVVLALEVVRGILDDVYLLARGHDPVIYLGWIVIHLVIVVTGLLAIRAAHRPRIPAT
ncbi:MAG: BphX family protein [Nitriliruptoraceae bacterium]